MKISTIDITNQVDIPKKISVEMESSQGDWVKRSSGTVNFKDSPKKITKHLKEVRDDWKKVL